MPRPSPIFSITEKHRTGVGVFPQNPGRFDWSAADHLAPVGDLPLHLDVKTIRTAILGGNEVVEQVVSATWQPFRIRGQWNDKWIGASKPALPLPSARQTFDDFRKLVERAPLVRIDFDGLSMEGILTELQVRYRRAAVIHWEVTFSPHKYKDGGQRAAQVQSVTRPLVSHAQDAQDSAAAAQAQLDEAKSIPMTDDLRSTIGDKIGELEGFASRARTAADAGLATDATRGLLRLATTFSELRGAAQGVALAGVRARSDLQVAFDSAAQTLRFVGWTRGTNRTARKAVLRAHEAEQDALRLARSKPRAIHRPHEGESLYRISERYYGTPDGWRRIFEANHLSSLRLQGTEELVIPEQAA